MSVDWHPILRETGCVTKSRPCACTRGCRKPWAYGGLIDEGLATTWGSFRLGRRQSVHPSCGAALNLMTDCFQRTTHLTASSAPFDLARNMCSNGGFLTCLRLWHLWPWGLRVRGGALVPSFLLGWVSCPQATRYDCLLTAILRSTSCKPNSGSSSPKPGRCRKMIKKLSNVFWLL